MSWQNTEFLLKGIFLGLLVYAGLELRGSAGWREFGLVALCTVGGLALFLSVAAVRLLAKGYRVKGRLWPFLAFLIMENPTLVYAGILLGLAGGSFTIHQGDAEIWPLAVSLGGGVVVGLLFLNLKNTDARYRLWFGLLLAAGMAAVGIWYLPQAFTAGHQRDLLGATFLLGIPAFYLLNLASVTEESEVEISGMCAALAVGGWLLCENFTTSNPNLQWFVLGIPAVTYYIYTRHILPGLRVFKHVLRGISYADAGRHRFALASLGRAVELDPKNQLARESLWDVHRKIDFHEVASDAETLALVNFDLCMDRVAHLLLLDRPQPASLTEAHRLIDLVASHKPTMAPRCDYWRAVACCHEKSFDEAQAALERVIVPEEGSANPQRSGVLFRAWQLALTLHPELKRRVGDPQIDLPRRRMEAIAAVERRLAGKPEDTDAFNLKQVLYNDLTESQYRQFAGDKPAPEFDHEYVKALGLALLANKERWQRGTEFLRIAARGLPAEGPALLVHIAKANERAGSIDGLYDNYELAKQAGLAVGHDNLATDVRPQFFAVVKALGEDAARRGDLDTAIANYHLYTEYERAGLETYRLLADLYEKKKDPWMALHCTEHGLSYDKTDEDLHSRRDRYYYSVMPADLAERRDQVLKWFDVNYCIGKARFLLDKGAENLDLLDWANHLVELAQVIKPTSFSVRVLRARIARRRGEIEQSTALLEEVRNNKPEKFPSTEEEDAWYTACKMLGDFYLHDKPDLAVACFQDFRKSTKSGADTWYKLGVAYESLGDAPRAVKCYQQVIGYEGHPLGPEAQDGLRRLQVPSS